MDDSLPPRTAILEAVFVLECVAPRRLDVERFLPPLPVTVAIDSKLQHRVDFAPNERASVRAGDRQYDISPMRKVLAALIPPMLEQARVQGDAQCALHSQQALARASAMLDAEILRIEALAQINPSVRPQEIQALRDERDQLLAVLPNARPRLDSVRLVTSADFLSLRRESDSADQSGSRRALLREGRQTAPVADVQPCTKHAAEEAQVCHAIA